VDPDAGLIVATAATAGNVGDAAAAPVLLGELLEQTGPDPSAPPPAPSAKAGDGNQPMAYGDSAYGAGPLLARLHAAGIDPNVKVQAPVAPAGHFTKDQFQVDLGASTVTCPSGHSVLIGYRANPHARHQGVASLGRACASCPLASRCTSSRKGRTVTITGYEAELAAARARQADPTRAADYWATRPKVEQSWPIWSAAAMAAAAPGSEALARSPPTSVCWPPRSTWPGWACSACIGPNQMGGSQHEPTGAPTTGNRATRRPVRQPRQPASQHRVLPPAQQDIMPDRSATLISMARFTPTT
jgi:DDE family transposase